MVRGCLVTPSVSSAQRSASTPNVASAAAGNHQFQLGPPAPLNLQISHPAQPQVPSYHPPEYSLELCLSLL